MSRNTEERRYTSAKERADKQGTGFSAAYLKLPDKTQLFKPKPGVMLLDIIPFEAGEGNPWASKGKLHWERTIWVHKGIGANNDSYLCPRLASKERCPICEHRAKLMKSADTDPDTEQLIKDLAPKQRQLFNVINLKDPDKGVQLWDVSYHLFGKVLDARLRNSDEEDEFESFFFMEGGKSLKIGFVEKSFGGATFCEAETIDFRDRKEDYEESILDDSACLDDILVVSDYDAIKQAFLQTDEEVAPKLGKSKSASVDDDDDDDDDDDAPAPKSKKPAPKNEEDWDDDDAPAPKAKHRESEPEPEEEEEPAPRSKHKSPPVEDDDTPEPKRKRSIEEDDDVPRVRTHTKEEMAESHRPGKSASVDDDDDDDAPAPKSKKPAPVDDDDDWDDGLPPRQNGAKT